MQGKCYCIPCARRRGVGCARAACNASIERARPASASAVQCKRRQVVNVSL
nr:MAG TPA: hypothetical protein [Caudoviricetes sp.]